MTGHMACCEDPFSKENPNGYLNFGIAENRLIDDLALEVLNRKANCGPEHIHYAPLAGLESLRNSFASFAKEFLNAPEVSAENVIVQSGLSAMCESMAFAIFNEGDEIILPSPYYTGFKFDFEGRFGVKLVPAQMSDFEHRIEDIEKVLSSKTKAILLTTPHNPTGDVLSESYLKQVAELCKKKNLHLISDEIYALSIHDNRTHLSILEVEKDYENIHLLYGMAKDFGLAGIKTGFYYSRNRECVEAMSAATYFHPVSTYTQALVADFLADANAVKDFTHESNARVSKALALLKSLLPEVKIHAPEAGMFLMADFRELLPDNGSEDELFKRLLNESKINMTPGMEMGLTVPGYFRVCYARDEDELQEFARRLRPLLKR